MIIVVLWDALTSMDENIGSLEWAFKDTRTGIARSDPPQLLYP